MPILNASKREIFIRNRDRHNSRRLSIIEVINQDNHIAIATKIFSYRVYKHNGTKIIDRNRTFIIKDKHKDKFNSYKFIHTTVLNAEDIVQKWNRFLIFARHTIAISLVKV